MSTKAATARTAMERTSGAMATIPLATTETSDVSTLMTSPVRRPSGSRPPCMRSCATWARSALSTRTWALPDSHFEMQDNATCKKMAAEKSASAGPKAAASCEVAASMAPLMSRAKLTAMTADAQRVAHSTHTRERSFLQTERTQRSVSSAWRGAPSARFSPEAVVPTHFLSLIDPHP